MTESPTPTSTCTSALCKPPLVSRVSVRASRPTPRSPDQAGCQNKMLRRKHQQVRPSALGSQKACAQIASLHANIDFEPASSEAQSKSSRCMAASSIFFALCDFSEGCWVRFASARVCRGSACTPTLLSTSDVPCNKKMLHLRKVVRAASLRTPRPRS